MNTRTRSCMRVSQRSPKIMQVCTAGGSQCQVVLQFPILKFVFLGGLGTPLGPIFLGSPTSMPEPASCPRKYWPCASLEDSSGIHAQMFRSKIRVHLILPKIAFDDA